MRASEMLSRVPFLLLLLCHCSGNGTITNVTPDMGADMGLPVCKPGQALISGSCVTDCRFGNAVPCATPLTCDYLSGTCQDPNLACVLSGKVTPCGQNEFPPNCGPGSQCDSAAGTCVPTAQCQKVVCDATNVCRGTQCTLAGGQVSGVTLSSPDTAMAGKKAGLSLSATVTAMALCGLNVSFELRRDKDLFISAGNDQAIWHIPFGGQAQIYLQESSPLTGLTADRKGTLYYILSQSRQVNVVDTSSGKPVGKKYAGPISGSGVNDRIARMVFGPDGLLYLISGLNVHRITPDGTDTVVATAPDEARLLSGLVFDRDGSLILGPGLAGKFTSIYVYRLAPGKALAERLLDWGPVQVGDLNPWIEGLAISPSGQILAGVFPGNPDGGFIFRVDPGPTATRVLGLSDIQKDVPATGYAGIHGLAYGSDGSLYFTNQNTDVATGKPTGQTLALRPSGHIEQLYGSMNFDWNNGLDGDIVVARETVASLSAPVDAHGVAMGTLDVPAQPGNYQVRVLVTDPKSGAISEAWHALVVQ